MPNRLAKEYIERVWDFKELAFLFSDPSIAFKTKEEWLKENGVI